MNQSLFPGFTGSTAHTIKEEKPFVNLFSRKNLKKTKRNAIIFRKEALYCSVLSFFLFEDGFSRLSEAGHKAFSSSHADARSHSGGNDGLPGDRSGDKKRKISVKEGMAQCRGKTLFCPSGVTALPAREQYMKSPGKEKDAETVQKHEKRNCGSRRE